LKVEVAVVGAGPSGLSCAAALVRLGRKVAVLEAAEATGGTLRAAPGYLAPAAEGRTRLQTLQAAAGPAALLTGHPAGSLSGGPGAFRLEAGNRRLTAGAVVLASGVRRRLSPADHGLEPAYNLLGLSDMARLLADPQASLGRLRGRRVAFFLDVSAPDSLRQQAAAMHLGIAVRRQLAAEVLWFGRDLKVAGDGLEARYREARDLGVTFFRDAGRPPMLTATAGGYRVWAWPEEGGEPVEVAIDLAVLDEREEPCLPQWDLGPRRENSRLGHRSPRPGIFVTGSLRADLDLEGCLVDGVAAAAVADAFLRGLDGLVRAEVDAPRCARCLTCVRLCPHRAMAIAWYREADRAAAKVDKAACRGCGVCVAACPALAITLTTCPDEDIYRQLESGGRTT